MALEGILVDLDGTLVDSNPVHVVAWMEAMHRHGYAVGVDRIAVQIGKGGDNLVPDVLGRSADQADGDSLRALEAELFAALASRVGLPVMRGAEALLTALRHRGLRLVLATSSSQQQLEVIEAHSRVKWRELVDEVVTADDVGSSKPSPDVVQAGLRKLHMTSAQCTLIGDTIWDVQASTRAGVAAVGLASVEDNGRVLRAAGARRVYRDPADLEAHLDEALHALSPSRLRLDGDTLAELMRQALASAEEALLAGDLPVGAVVVSGEGELLGRGHERVVESDDRLRHATLDALSSVRLRSEGAVLVCTLEPCLMCLGAALETSVDTIAYGLALHRDAPELALLDGDDRMPPRMCSGILADRCRGLLHDWLTRPARNLAQERWVRRVLARTV